MLHLQKQLARNVWTSWVGYAVRITVSFFFVPYITSVLGDARYGVWVIVFQTINYFTLLDFGFEKALVRFISKNLGNRAFDRINRILNTTFAIYLAIGTIIILGAWLVSTLLFGYFKISDPSFESEGRTALIIIGLYMGSRFYLLPFAGSLGGFQRFDISNLLHMLEDVIRALVMVWLLYEGYGLVPLAWTILGMSLLRQVAAIIWVRWLHPEIRFGPSYVHRETARELFDYSKITFGITLGWLVIFNTDSILLGLMSSAAAAGIYAPAAQMMLYLRNVVNVVASPLTTAVSQHESAGNMEAVRLLYLKGVRYAAYFSFFAAVGVIMYARPFVALWLVKEFAPAGDVMRLLALGAAFFIPQIVGNAVLFGIDRHRYLLQVVIVEAVLKLALSLFLIPRYGLIGMAFAAALPQMVLYVSLYPVLIGKALEIPPLWVTLNLLRSGFIALFAALPASIVMRYLVPPATWPTFVLNVVVVLAIGLVGAWFALLPGDREKLLIRFRL